MLDWQAWNDFFRWLRDEWPIILLGLIGLAWTLTSPWLGGLFRWLLGSQTSRLVKTVDDPPGDGPIRLAPRHTKKPSAYPLKGKRVIVTGLVRKLDHIDTERPSMELHAFPFSIDAEIECEFPKDYAPDLHRRNTLQLVSVIGTAAENFKIKASYDSSLLLRLTDCELTEPRFFDQFRNVWRDTPIAILYQRLRYGY